MFLFNDIMMKKFLFNSILLSILICQASCSDKVDELLEEKTASQEVQLVFKAMPDNGLADTRSYLNVDQVEWNDDDIISLFSGTANPSYPFVAMRSGLDVFFTGAVTATADYYYALYPYSADATIAAADNTTITIPFSAEQTAVDNSFANEANVTVAKTSADAKAFSFKNVCGLMRFKILADYPKDITKVVLSNTSESIAGTLIFQNVEALASESFVANPNAINPSSPFTTSISGDGKSITLNAPVGGFANNTYYFFVVPPTTFTTGFSITYSYKIRGEGVETEAASGTISINGEADLITRRVVRSMILDAGTLTYSRPTFAITVVPNNVNYGTVTKSPEKDEYNVGDWVELTATPNSESYEFKQWNDGNTENPRIIEVGAENKTYTATFEAVPAP